MAKKELSWSKKEVKLLVNCYPSGICPEDLLKKLPKRTWSSILHKAHHLGLKKGTYTPKIRKSRKWTQAEIDFVRTYYGQKSDKWIQERLTDRSICSIKRAIKIHKPKNEHKKTFSRNPSWSEFEDALLLEHYNKKTTDELTKIIPNRTYDAIRAHIGVLKLKRTDKHLYRAQKDFRWTDEEKNILKANKAKSIASLQKLLPERTLDSIRCMLKRLENYYLELRA